jgi:PIN domain nuclease of toxin-antitoxin system
VSFLADACALIAFHGGSGAGMSRAARQAMAEADVSVSPITVWEITRKAALGKLPPPVPRGFRGTFREYLGLQGYHVAPFGWLEAEQANSLPAFHNDPMDRMLIATALNHGMTIITCDAIFARYPVPTLW